MTRPFTCCSLCRNPPLTGKDEPAGPAPTEGSDTYILALAMSCAPILAPPVAPAPALAPAAVNSMVKYSEADF